MLISKKLHMMRGGVNMYEKVTALLTGASFKGARLSKNRFIDHSFNYE